MRRASSRAAGAAGLGLALVTLAGCAGRQEDVPLAYPLGRRVTYFGSETFISAAPGVPLSSLCDLKGFRDLRPDMTADEASKIYGQPTSRYQEFGGRRTVYVFSVGAGAHVEIVRQMVGSEDPQVESWTPRLSVVGKGLGQIVAPEVVAAVPEEQRGFVLHLDSGGWEAATIEFEAGRPKWLWWEGDGPPEGKVSKGGGARLGEGTEPR